MSKCIKMSATRQGSEDGLEVKTFKEGEKYEVESSLADVFIDAKDAKEIKQKQKSAEEVAAEKEAAEKAEKEAAENKNKGNAPSNKSK